MMRLPRCCRTELAIADRRAQAAPPHRRSRRNFGLAVRSRLLRELGYDGAPLFCFMSNSWRRPFAFGQRHAQLSKWLRQGYGPDLGAGEADFPRMYLYAQRAGNDGKRLAAGVWRARHRSPGGSRYNFRVALLTAR
jgi:hypothetical protein